mmetsp:Transcript_2875/g.5086  ORF Transcript_2875/g.5086 Transcript_2875/m.5086 type:complete len:101 (+) Transcript_2875:943-1245(+)
MPPTGMMASRRMFVAVVRRSGREGKGVRVGFIIMQRGILLRERNFSLIMENLKIWISLDGVILDFDGHAFEILRNSFHKYMGVHNVPNCPDTAFSYVIEQ